MRSTPTASVSIRLKLLVCFAGTGVKILASASTRRSVGHEKLSEREQYWQATVERLLAEAQQTDQEEDQRFGKGKSADSLPEELAHAKSRLERIRQAKAELEKEARSSCKPLSRIILRANVVDRASRIRGANSRATGNRVPRKRIGSAGRN